MSGTNYVDIRSTGRVLAVPEGRTILDAALDAGIPWPHGCRAGRCGGCKSRLISGDVDLLDHTRFALSAEEKGQGLILACRALPKGNVCVSWLGGIEEVAKHLPHRVEARVVSVEDATHDIKRVRLALGNGESLPFLAGQYARLSFPYAPTRDYSMANRPGDPQLEFHIRRVPGGAATERIHGATRVGDTVWLEGPFGSSFLREKHAAPIVCIAGGSGLAPITSIVETALANGMKQPIHVYFGARTERDIYLVDHFKSLEARHTNVAFNLVLSQAPVHRAWRSGIVTDAVAQDLEDLDGWKAYVAGPPAMVEVAMQVLGERGLRAQDLHADVFFTPQAASPPPATPANRRSVGA
jgi:CDP-4-dehydro-6-deoxyglucose reductase/ferredoxin-NAD(P)+ reductase (naphthalene dioxygenase ferredoxin-specific)